jgi:osmotically-inducible protein OsmY
MNYLSRNALISLVPLLTPIIAYAEIAEPTTLSSTSHKISNAHAWRSTQVIGQAVKNSGNETIGTVQDLLLDMKSGAIQAVVISSGGFLGIADTLSAVPVSALRFDVDAKAFKTKLTKEQLVKAPQFKTTIWPDFSDAAMLEAMRSYRDFIHDGTTAADNSAQNDTTLKQNAILPTSQGSSEKDIQITKDIRSSIIATELSFNAKNIKIITKDEHVFLRGVVENHSEHLAILDIAKNHVSANEITDELSVKTK